MWLGLLLEKGEIVRAGNYLSKIDDNNFSLEASSIELPVYFFLKGHGIALQSISFLWKRATTGVSYELISP
jgi:hypothetical protein